MPSFQFKRSKHLTEGEWTLSWDQHQFSLVDPDRDLFVEGKTDQIHRAMDLDALFDGMIVSFESTLGKVRLEGNPEGRKAVTRLVCDKIRADYEFENEKRRHIRREYRRGLTLLLGGGIPFALYCLLAASAVDPATGTWKYRILNSIGPIIRYVLMFCMVSVYGGLRVLWSARSQASSWQNIKEQMQTVA